MTKKLNKKDQIPEFARPLFNDWAESFSAIEDSVMEYEIQNSDFSNNFDKKDYEEILVKSQSLGLDLCNDIRWLISESKKNMTHMNNNVNELVIDAQSKEIERLTAELQTWQEASKTWQEVANEYLQQIAEMKPEAKLAIGDVVVMNTYAGVIVGYTTDNKIIVEWPDVMNGKYYADVLVEDETELILVQKPLY